ncbi:MAG: aminopeptidase P family N-terminal domain-containing protein, partial [Sphingomonas sp.]|nr:aminopeptidase P family N-terminal domain-containing protein [Sphingomonas sp.]
MNLDRRAFLGTGAAAALLPAGLASGAAAQPQGASIKLPPAITREERLARLANARSLMQRHGIGAIVVEPGASLDYYTGVQWRRSERLTAA